MIKCLEEVEIRREKGGGIGRGFSGSDSFNCSVFLLMGQWECRRMQESFTYSYIDDRGQLSAMTLTHRIDQRRTIPALHSIAISSKLHTSLHTCMLMSWDPSEEL
jgi:hypothetical protein